MHIFKRLLHGQSQNKEYFLKLFNTSSKPKGFFAEITDTRHVEIVGTIQRIFGNITDLTEFAYFKARIIAVAMTIDKKIKLTLKLFDPDENELSELMIVVDVLEKPTKYYVASTKMPKGVD